jgi:hypothetical protein
MQKAQSRGDTAIAMSRWPEISRSAASPPIDPEWSEVQQLKSVAMPLLFQLREDQKREVRSLAHIIGLGSVASLI